jgi:hypothetical protein
MRTGNSRNSKAAADACAGTMSPASALFPHPAATGPGHPTSDFKRLPHQSCRHRYTPAHRRNHHPHQHPIPATPGRPDPGRKPTTTHNAQMPHVPPKLPTASATANRTGRCHPPPPQTQTSTPTDTPPHHLPSPPTPSDITGAKTHAPRSWTPAGRSPPDTLTTHNARTTPTRRRPATALVLNSARNPTPAGFRAEFKTPATRRTHHPTAPTTPEEGPAPMAPTDPPRHRPLQRGQPHDGRRGEQPNYR